MSHMSNLSYIRNRRVAEFDMCDGTFVIERLRYSYELSVEYLSAEPGGQDKTIRLASGESPAQLLTQLEDFKAKIDQLAEVVRNLP